MDHWRCPCVAPSSASGDVCWAKPGAVRVDACACLAVSYVFPLSLIFFCACGTWYGGRRCASCEFRFRVRRLVWGWLHVTPSWMLQWLMRRLSCMCTPCVFGQLRVCGSPWMCVCCTCVGLCPERSPHHLNTLPHLALRTARSLPAAQACDLALAPWTWRRGPHVYSFFRFSLLSLLSARVYSGDCQAGRHCIHARVSSALYAASMCVWVSM